MFYLADASTTFDSQPGQLGGAIPPAPSAPTGGTTTIISPYETPAKPGTQPPSGGTPIIIDQPIRPGSPGSTTPYTGPGETITGIGGGGGLQVPLPNTPATGSNGGGCTRCQTGTSPNPNAPVAVNPPGQAAAAAAPSTTLATIAGLPWWVWVLGLLAISAAFDRSK